MIQPASFFGDSIDGISYSNIIPVSGGSKSLRLAASHWGGINLVTFITGQIGTNIYQLTVNSKYNPHLPKYTIEAAVGMDKWAATSAYSLTYLDTIPSWKQYAITDTISTVATDTIAVYLHVYAGQLTRVDYLFDNIELQIIRH